MKAEPSCVSLPATSPAAVLWRAALAGGATGLRSTVAIASLIDGGAPGLPAPLTRPRARTAARIAVAAELVIDKLPWTPSRLERRGLTARVASAAAAVVLGRDANGLVLPKVLVAATATLVSARVGHDVRVAAEKRFPPLAAAAVEDALALTLAAAARR